MSYTSNKRQRLLILVLTVAMIISMVPAFSSFADTVPAAEATERFSNATDIAAGNYEADKIEKSGGTGKVKIECKGITIKDGKSYGKIMFTSKTYPAFSVNIDGGQSQYVTTTAEPSASYEKGTATAEIPVALNKEFEMSAYSSKMKTWIKYKLTITLNKEASKEYGFTVKVIKTDGATESNALDEAKLKLMSSDGAAIAPDKKNADNYEYKLEGDANLTAELNDDYEVAVKNVATGKWESTGRKTFSKAITKADDKAEITIAFLKKLKLPEEPGKLTKGIYKVLGDPEKIGPDGIGDVSGSKMFRIVKATLTVGDDGKPVLADIYLSGTGYDAIYVGKKTKDAPTGAITKTNSNNLWTSANIANSQAFVAREDGGLLHYVIPVSDFGVTMDFLAKSKKYDQWSHKKLLFYKDKLEKIQAADSRSEYDVLEGKEVSVKQGEKAVIRVDAPHADFHEVIIDGEPFDSTQYTTKSGSTIVSINTSSLAKGRHTVMISYAGGRYATAVINITQGNATNPGNQGTTPAVSSGQKSHRPNAKGSSAPNTGDVADMQLMALALLASFGAIVAIYRKKASR